MTDLHERIKALIIEGAAEVKTDTPAPDFHALSHRLGVKVRGARS